MRRVILLVALVCSCVVTARIVSAQHATVPPAAPGREPAAVIPFVYNPVTAPLMIVRMSLNGSDPLPFVFDTGAYFVVLDRQAARNVSLKTAIAARYAPIRRPGASLGTPESARLVTSAPATSVDLHPPVAKILDLSGLQQSLGTPVAGLLGMMPFSRAVVRIDFMAQTISVYRANSVPPPTGPTTVLPLYRRAADRLYFTRVALAPGDSTDLVVDTGSPVTVLAPRAVAKLTVTGARTEVDTTTEGVSVAEIVDVERAALGGFAERSLEFRVRPPETPRLGLDVLRRFLVTLDFPRQRMILERRPDYAATIRTPGWSGIGVVSAGSKCFVGSVVPGSPAAGAGVVVGDQLLLVNGYRTVGISATAAERLVNGLDDLRADLVVRRRWGENVMLAYRRGEPPRTSARYGLYLERKDGRQMHVTGVAPGLPAYIAGVRTGDVIVTIGGISADQITVFQLGAALSARTLDLTLRAPGTGETRSVQLVAQPAGAP